MRVLHVISGLLTGGAENMLLRIAKDGVSRGMEQRVVALADGPMRQRLTAAGIQVDVLQTGSFLNSIKTLWTLKSIVNEWRPSIVQGWMYHGNLAATWAAGFALRRHTVWNIRQTLYDIRRERRLTAIIIRLGKVLSCCPNAIIYNSNVSKHQHEVFGYRADRSLYIGNGVDVNALVVDPVLRAEWRRQLDLESAIVVGLAARYHPMKGHANFIRAVGAVATRNPTLKIVLAGRNLNDNAELQKLIDEFNLRSRVVSLGELQDMKRFYSVIDVCVSASLWGEGFPNVLVEAMTCAVPCVATDVGDSRRIVEGVGEVVAAGDIDALANAIDGMVRLSESERIELGLRARAKVFSEFNLSRVAEEYATLYRRTAGAMGGVQ